MSKHNDECNDGMGVITNDAALLHYIEGRVHEDEDVVCVTVQAIKCFAVVAIIRNRHAATMERMNDGIR